MPAIGSGSPGASRKMRGFRYRSVSGPAIFRTRQGALVFFARPGEPDQSNRNAVFGLDFPFGLPISLVKEHAWDEFIMAFPSSFPNPDDFKKKCFSKAGNQELRRRTDCEAHTPFSPYNLRLYKQTYYGISKVLFPLILIVARVSFPFISLLQASPHYSRYAQPPR